MKRRKRSVIVSIACAMMLAMIAVGALRALPAEAGENKEETLEYDLRNGYLRQESYGNCFCSVLSSFRFGGDDSPFFDLDGDGTADVKISTCYTFRYYDHDVLTPVFGGSIHGDYVLKPTEEHPLSYEKWDYNAGCSVTHNVSSVVFHFPAEPVKEEYSLSGTGVKIFRYVLQNDEYVAEEITKASPGEEIELLEDKKAGQYLKAWKTDGLPKDDLTEVFAYETDAGESVKNIVAVRRFIMPAHDVTLEPVYENQRPYTIQVDGPNDYMVGNTEVPTNAVDCLIDSLYNSEFYEYWELGYCDLDGDGTDDIYIGPYKSNESLNVCLLSNLTSYTVMARNDGPYWPVTLSWKEEPTFTVDPAAMYYAASSYKNGMLLYQSLKAYETKDREGFFDLNQDGSEDLRFDGFSFNFLSTCSVKDSVTIPAVPEGINHPVTFVVREIPKSSNYHKVTLIFESKGQVYCNIFKQTKIGEWYQEGELVTLIPEEGYELFRVKIDGATVTLQDYEKAGYSYGMPDHDIEIRVWLRNIAGENPSPIQDEYFTVTVEGGWIDGPAAVKEGNFVRIYADCRADGLYVGDWMVEGVMGWSYWEGELSFQVGNQDVYVTPEYRKTHPLTIDLSDGEWDYTIDMLNCVCDAINLGPYDRHLYYDLDGDGNMDIMAVSSQMKFTPLKTYSCGESYTLEGGTRGPYYPITFVYKPKKEATEVTVTPTPTGEPGDNSNGEPSETGEKPADTAEKKDDSSFHPLYIIIPASIIIFAAATAALMIKRKRDKREKLP